MKKLLRTLLLTALLTAALCVCALAAEPTQAGIYDLSAPKVTLVPLDAAGEVITVDNSDDAYPGYYADAVKFTISDPSLTAGNQYLLLVLKNGEDGTATITADSIVYIDQKAANADGSITFTAYPSALTKGSYKVYILGDGRAFSAGPAATFSYYQPYTLGDVNEDGDIDSKDALRVLRIAAELVTPTETERLASDVNGDGAVDAKDALRVLRYAAGIISSLES